MESQQKATKTRKTIEYMDKAKGHVNLDLYVGDSKLHTAGKIATSGTLRHILQYNCTLCGGILWIF